MIEPNRIYLLTPKWSTEIMVDPRQEPLCYGSKTEAGWSIVLALPSGGKYKNCLSFLAQNGPMKGSLYQNGAMEHWGLRKIGPGTWAVDPSVWQPPLHAYLVLCEVPEPAPWE